MQVEESENNSGRRLTKSLISPATSTPPPKSNIPSQTQRQAVTGLHSQTSVQNEPFKFIFLGSQQDSQ